MIETTTERGAVVLDPWAGSGGSCVVATRLGRNWIGIDHSIDSINTIKKRFNEDMELRLTEMTISREIPIRNDAENNVEELLTHETNQIEFNEISESIAELDLNKIKSTEIKYKVKLSQKQWDELKVRFYHANDGICEECSRPCPTIEDSDIHHIKAREAGGDDSDNNLIFLCVGCHRRKHKGPKTPK